MENPRNDYALEQLEKITVHGVAMFVMPRYVQRYVAGYEPFSVDLMVSLLAPDATVLDVGAHYGIYSIVAAANSDQARVIAVEPVPENAEVLRMNIDANGLENVTVAQCALSDARGSSALHLPWASDSASFQPHPRVGAERTIEVDVRTGADLLHDTTVDFVKIDAEGHELHVLTGMRDALVASPDAVLLVEMNPKCLRAAGADPVDLVHTLLDLEKDVFVVDEDRRRLIKLTSRPDKWQNWIPSDAYRNLLCRPRVEKGYAVFVSHSSSLGGAERSMIDVARGLRDCGMTCHTVVPNDGPVVGALANASIGCSTIEFHWWASDARNRDMVDERESLVNLLAIRAIARLAEELGVDVIVSSASVIPWGAYAADLAAVPHVWFVNEFGEQDHNLRFHHGAKDTMRELARLSDLVVANSFATRRHVVEHVPPDKVLVLYRDFDKAMLRKRSAGWIDDPYSPQDELKIVLVGHVRPSKGQLDAVGAVGELRRRGLRVGLCLVGEETDEEYGQRLRDAVDSAGISAQVHFAGYRENPYPYMRAADVALMCSTSEAFGRVTVEAMLLGRPVVGARAGATPEIVTDGVDGLLYTVADFRELADKLEQLARHPERRRELGISAEASATARFAHGESARLLRSHLVSLSGEREGQLPLAFRDLLHVVPYWAEMPDVVREMTASRDLAAVYQSTAWRITAPLRRLFDALKRARKR